MIKKALYIIGYAIGSILIGFFANKLDTPLSIALFAVGVLLLTVSAYASAKGGKMKNAICNEVIKLATKQGIDSWMALADKVKDSFPALETEEALNEEIIEALQKANAQPMPK